MLKMISRRIAAALPLALLSASLALAQVQPGQSPLSGAKGGTNNAFMQFAGPSTAIKTFTLPDQTDTIATLGAIQTFTAAKTFASGKLLLGGSSSGAGTLNAPAAASTYVWSLPAATDTLVGKATTDTLTNKTFDTAGTGNSFSINGLAATANTGTGAVARATSPTFVTPTLGAATATSINGNVWTTGTGTLTLGAGKTATISNTLTFTGTDTSSVAFGGGGTVAYTANNLSAFASTTSAQLAGIISDETGSGALVFGTSPSLTTPTLGVASATTINKVTITAPATGATLTIPDGVTLTGPAASGTAMTLGNVETVSGAKSFNSGTLIQKGSSSGTTTVQASATASGTLTLPAATDTLVGKATTDTLSNKTFDTASSNTLKVNGNSLSASAGTATLTLPNATDTIVGRATTDTLTNKTLTSPVIGTIVNTGTLTLPTSTDTLLGRATTDTLTNKTLDTASNAFKLNGTTFTTATNATAALNAMVGDSGSGGTKGLVPAPGAGDFAAGKYLDASGAWSIPAGGGGGGGMTDNERQDFLLTLAYQSKSFAAYRRVPKRFADGFKASDGINSGSSSNYTVDTSSGALMPTFAAAGTPTSIGSAVGSTTATTTDVKFTTSAAVTSGNRVILAISVLKNTSITVSSVSDGTNAFTKAVNGAAISSTLIDTEIWYRDYPSGLSSGTTITATTSTTASGNGWAIAGVQVSGLTAVAPDKTASNGTNGASSSALSTSTGTLSQVTELVIGAAGNSGHSWTTPASGFTDLFSNLTASGTDFPVLNFAYQNVSSTGSVTYSLTPSTLSNMSMALASFKVSSTANNITVVTTAQTASSTVSNGRVLLEIDNTATPTLNTDLTVEVTCDGGTHWTSATLSSVGTGQGGRLVVETADTATTGGTSFAARIKTFNNKSVPIYALTMSVH